MAKENYIIMELKIQSLKTNSKLSQGLFIIGVLVFAPYTLLTVGSTLFSALPFTFASPIGLWLFLLSWLLLAHTEVYLFICVGFIILSILMLLGNPSRKQAMAFVLLLGMVLLFVLAPYSPAVKAAKGYRMIVPTEPAILMRGLKNAQALAEVTPCKYQLLGWQEDTLFYQSKCGDDNIRTWQFSPENMKKTVEYLDSSLPKLYTKALGREETLEQVAVENIYPPSEANSVRSLYVSEPGLLSPNKKWLALVSQYLYSTQDVVLVRPD